jgi:hypothetical protein
MESSATGARPGPGSSPWRAWLWLWSPALVPAAAWTAATLPLGALVASAILFAACGAVYLGAVSDRGDPVPWSRAAGGCGCAMAMLGPTVSAPLLGLAVVVAMVLTTPGVTSRLRRGSRDAERPIALLSDWELEGLWVATGQQLGQRPDDVLDVVQRREELLDELIRRRSGVDGSAAA